MVDWIPVSVQLPLVRAVLSEPVLVTVRIGSGKHAISLVDVDRYDPITGYWVMYGVDVVSWRPLPEPDCETEVSS